MKAGDIVKGPVNPLLRDSLTACKRVFGAIVLFSLCINLLMLTAPLFMLQVFDRVLSSRSTDTLSMLMLIAGFALLVMAALELFRSLVLVRVSTWLDSSLGGPVLMGSIAATLRKGSDPTIQGLRDLNAFRTFLSGPSIFPIIDAPWTPIFLAVIFMLHPLLGWFSLAGAVALFCLAITNELATRKLLAHSGAESIKALQFAQATVRNADVIEAMGMMPSVVRRWQSRNAQSLVLQAQASDRSGALTAVSKFFRLILQVGILSVGAWLVIHNELTPGAMIAGSILMGRALAPVEQAIASWKSIVAARSAYERLKRQLDETPFGKQTMPLPAPSGRVTVEGVSFIHPGASEPTIRAVAFDLEPGEALGLIGPTAAGKTTLARLLVGNLVPRAGHVRLDDMDVAQWDSADRGPHIGYLPQDIELFGGGVAENIARMGEGDPDAVVSAAQLAGVHEMILRLPKGYDTEIGEGGAALSGGQRQRIALARAMYGEPKFVVLDEPNANLDNEGEEALIRALRILKEKGVTVVSIAHRPSILQNTDKVLVLREGSIQAFGPRNEIIPKLAALQSSERPEAHGRPLLVKE